MWGYRDFNSRAPSPPSSPSWAKRDPTPKPEPDRRPKVSLRTLWEPEPEPEVKRKSSKKRSIVRGMRDFFLAADFAPQSQGQGRERGFGSDDRDDDNEGGRGGQGMKAKAVSFAKALAQDQFDPFENRGRPRSTRSRGSSMSGLSKIGGFSRRSWYSGTSMEALEALLMKIYEEVKELKADRDRSRGGSRSRKSDSNDDSDDSNDDRTEKGQKSRAVLSEKRKRHRDRERSNSISSSVASGLVHGIEKAIDKDDSKKAMSDRMKDGLKTTLMEAGKEGAIEMFRGSKMGEKLLGDGDDGEGGGKQKLPDFGDLGSLAAMGFGALSDKGSGKDKKRSTEKKKFRFTEVNDEDEDEASDIDDPMAKTMAAIKAGSKSKPPSKGKEKAIDISDDELDQLIADLLPPKASKPASSSSSRPTKPSSGSTSSRPSSVKDKRKSDPTSLTPQAFDWPSQEEIDEANRDRDRGDTNDGSRPREAGPSARSRGGEGRSLTRDLEGISRSMASREIGGEATPGSRHTKTASPKASKASEKAPARPRIVTLPSEAPSSASTLQSDFGPPQTPTVGTPFEIVFPSTPTHEPVKTLQNDVPPQQPTAGQNFPGMPGLPTAIPKSELEAAAAHNPIASLPLGAGNVALYTSAVASMESCLAMLRDLGISTSAFDMTASKKQSPKEIILQWLGDWFMEQVPAFQRANELFAHAHVEDQIRLIEGLARLQVNIQSSVEAADAWSPGWQAQFGKHGFQVKEAFLAMSTGAVLSYLETTIWSLRSTIPAMLKECAHMIADGRGDPARVLDMVPKLRGGLHGIPVERLKDSTLQGNKDEALGLLDILYALSKDLQENGRPSNLEDVSQSIPPMSPMESYSRPESPTLGFVVATDRPRSGTNVLQAPIHSKERMKKPVDRSMAVQNPDDIGVSDRQTRATAGDERSRGFEGVKPRSCMDPREEHVFDQGMREPTPAGHLSSSNNRGHQPDVHPAAMAFATAGHLDSFPAGWGQQQSALEHCHPAAMLLPPYITNSYRNPADQPFPQSEGAPPVAGMAGTVERGGKPPIKEKDLHEAVPILRQGPRKHVGPSILHSPSQASPLRSSVHMDDREDVEIQMEKPRSAERTISTMAESSESEPILASLPPLDETKVWNSPSAASLAAEQTGLGGVANMGGQSWERGSRSMAEDTFQASRPQSALQTPSPSAGASAIAMPVRPSSSAISAITEDEDGEVILDGPMLSSRVRPTIQTGTSSPAAIDSGTATRPAEPVTVSAPMQTQVSAPEAADETTSANQVMTSADILAGKLDERLNEEIEAGVLETEDSDTPAALTKAEEELMKEDAEAEQLDGLIPGPKVVTSQDIRKHRYNYTDFPNTLRSAVPRVEVTPGAITNVKGEKIPLADEAIHLNAGEKLIDGSGRVWDKDGVIEPGKDDQGRFIVYDADVEQVRRANNGKLPAFMPWEDMAPDSETPSRDEPSYRTGDEWSDSDISMSLPASTISTPALRPRPSLRVTPSEADIIEHQLDVNDGMAGIDEIEEIEEALANGDGLDDIDIRKLEEEDERMEEAGKNPTPATPMTPDPAQFMLGKGKRTV